MPARRIIAAGVAFAIAGALLVVPTAAGAATITDAAVTVPLEGLLRIVPVESGPEHTTLDAVDQQREPESAPTAAVEITLVTDAGTAVELAVEDVGPQWADAASGSRFDGEVAVPDEITGAVADEVAARAVDPAGPEAAAIAADIAATEDVALTVVDAQIAPPAPAPEATPTPRQVQALAAPRPHTLDVMWVARAGTAAPTAAHMQAAISRLSEFWASQSAGQVSSVTLRTAVQFRTVAFDPCDADRAWAYAAGQFGRTEQSYWSGSTASHLVVLAPAAACGPAVGLGTLGDGVGSGGLIWGSIELDRPAEWDQVTFHEFGHNLGLPHSNARVCRAPTTDSSFDAARQAPADPDCVDAEYQDRYDVMGGGHWVTDPVTGARVVSSLRDIAALSVVHKAQLDALPRGSDLLTLTIAGGEAQVVELAPISADSGVRGLELVDALTGEQVYVEYRSGTGRDAQSLYAQWPGAVGTTTFAPGVRVMRGIPNSCTVVACTIGYSTVLQRHTELASHAAWMGPGHSQTTYTGALTVTVLETTPERATVAIDFRDTPLEFTTLPTPAIVGPVHYGSTLSVAGVTADDWMPRANAVRYQWLRDGSPVRGATRSTYLLEETDIGRSISVRVTGVRPGYAVAPIATPPQTVTGPATVRIAGADRYLTAVEVSKAAFPGKAAVVYLATGTAFPDALAAAPAAALEGGPLLLVPSRGTVPASVLARMSQLDPARIVVVGGTGAVPQSIVAQVQRRVPGAKVKRLAGADRYETARAIIADSFRSRSSFVYVATGRTHADALAAAAAAASRGAPVVLVDGRSGGLDAASRRAITALAPTRILIAGGTGAVSTGVATELGRLAPVTRLSGPTRFETSVAVNREAFPTAPSAGHFWATGLDFPDALSGASLAAAKGAPLFVVWAGCVPPETAAEVGRTRASKVTLVGGPGAMYPAVERLDIC